jgi:hypothetical protein
MDFVEKFHLTMKETAGWKGMRVWLLVRSLIHFGVLLTISTLIAVVSQTQISNGR